MYSNYILHNMVYVVIVSCGSAANVYCMGVYFSSTSVQKAHDFINAYSVEEKYTINCQIIKLDSEIDFNVHKLSDRLNEIKTISR